MAEKKLKFNLTEPQWTKLAPLIRDARNNASKEGVTSKLVRNANPPPTDDSPPTSAYWLTLDGPDMGVTKAFVAIDGLLMEHAPQSAEQKKRKDELAEAMANWQRETGVTADGTTPASGLIIKQS